MAYRSYRHEPPVTELFRLVHQVSPWLWTDPNPFPKLQLFRRPKARRAA